MKLHMMNGLLTLLTIALLKNVAPAVELGNQRLREVQYAPLIGHRVAVLSNPTGVFIDSLEHIVDAMVADERVDIIAVFGPEHGFRGDKQAETGDVPLYIDRSTGLPVFSAYNMTIPQMAQVFVEMNITAMVVDMQDVGVRLYTFIWTMYNVMHAFTQAARSAKEIERLFLVLDRPNPIGGLTVDGPMLNKSCCESGYGKFPVPHIHGMTIGELALLFNSELRCDSSITRDDKSANSTWCTVKVMQMTGWERSMMWTDTTLPWIPPSPNLPTPLAALSYGATVFLEATTVSEGRGTTTPFQLFGAPFFDAMELADDLNNVLSKSMKKNAFRAAYFQPTYFKYANETIAGVQWFAERTISSTVTVDPDALLRTPFGSATVILCSAMRLAHPPDAFQWDGSWFGHPGTELIDEYAGTPSYREMIDAGFSPNDIISHYKHEADEFTVQRIPYLIY